MDILLGELLVLVVVAKAAAVVVGITVQKKKNKKCQIQPGGIIYSTILLN